MFTDIVGYTTLGQRDEALALAILEEHRKMLRPILIKHYGREIKTIGDAFLVEFPSALDAVRCGYDIQRTSRESNISHPSERRVHLRVGVHLGDVVEAEGDVLGDAVNVASRVDSLAEEDGVCVTQQVYDQVRNKFELPLVSLGKRILKNVSAPLEVYKIAMPWESPPNVKSEELDRRRLAVLPLENISADPNDEYFADGMTEELISTLSRITGLRVIARTSAMHYKGSGKRISEIGAELRVGSLLEGSVRKAGDRMRISVQLIDSSNEEHLWADDYDRKIEDVFEIQRDIAKSVADGLRVKLLSSDENHLDKRDTQNLAAYTLYLKGRHYWNERTKDGLNKALEYFEKAIEQDPEYARAYSGLADTYSILATQNYLSGAEALPKAKRRTERALELDSGLAEAHASLGFLHGVECNWGEAEREFKLAIELNPSYATAHLWYSITLTWLRRHEEAIEEAVKAEELDPFSPIMMIAVGQALAYARHYDEAIEELQRMTKTNPEVYLPHHMLGLAYLYKGLNELAIGETRKVVSIAGTDDWLESIIAIAEAGMGRTEGARELIRSLEGKAGQSWNLALLHAGIGENERAIEYLEKCYQENTFGLGWLRVIPTLDGLQGNPRYASLLDRMNLA
jgi:adenylate cyclase